MNKPHPDSTRSKDFEWQENGLRLHVATDSNGCARLLACGAPVTLPEPASTDAFQILQVEGPGESRLDTDSRGSRTTVSIPGRCFTYQSHREERNAQGLKIEMTLAADGLEATVHWQFFDGLPLLRAWTELRNTGDAPVGVQMIASFFLQGLFRSLGETPHADLQVHTCDMGWFDELRWQKRSLPELSLCSEIEQTSNNLRLSNTGNWSTKDHLPAGVLEGRERSIVWQIEHNGSWLSELGAQSGDLYLGLYGPREREHHWHRELQPGESFTSVTAAFGVCDGDVSDAFALLTQYRRRIRQDHPDYTTLPVIFNDYMNCLGGDPTTEKELPYIKAAADAGAEIYVVDAGWYAARKENWYFTVGEWQPSPDRFEGGILGLLDTIRAHGMKAGLWLELETMGIECPLLKHWPKECFFHRHGRPITALKRYQLDFRHPLVRKHSDEVVDRLVGEYGVAYIKMDYNIDAGPGTDLQADSFGDGLLQHNRAYLEWLDAAMARHPELIIENCSSGGLRMDYAQLSRHTLQSISDQEDVIKMAKIAASGATGATPEQQAMWVYPRASDSRERVIVSCVNGLAYRLHVSGELAYLSDEHRALVKECVDFSKSLRATITTALPFWPLGLPAFGAEIYASGLYTKEWILILVWNPTDTSQEVTIPLGTRIGSARAALSTHFPAREATARFDEASSSASFTLPPESARAALFKLS